MPPCSASLLVPFLQFTHTATPAPSTSSSSPFSPPAPVEFEAYSSSPSTLTEQLPLLLHSPLMLAAHDRFVAMGEKHGRTLQLLAAGGVAGGAARTVVAPLDRIKILMQTQALLPSATLASASSSSITLPLQSQDKYNGLVQALRRVSQEEGIKALWKGNLVNVTRVIPYSACQFATYDALKSHFLSLRSSSSAPTGSVRLDTRDRLLAGAGAGMMATLCTHPMDVVRLRLSVHSELHTSQQALRHVLAEGGARALFKGLVPTMLSVSPFIAVNFATFDALKAAYQKHLLLSSSSPSSAVASSTATLLMGAMSGLFAQSICYPLDTIRRRMQLRGRPYTSLGHALITITKQEGIKALYRGSSANALKIVPQNALRFLCYDSLSKWMGMKEDAAKAKVAL